MLGSLFILSMFLNSFTPINEVNFVQIREISAETLPSTYYEFIQKYGNGEADVNTPILFKGTALKWPVMDAASDEKLLESFGHRLSNVYRIWIDKMEDAVQSPLRFSEHLKSIHENPKECGYIVSGVRIDKPIVVPDEHKCTVDLHINLHINKNYTEDYDEEGEYLCGTLGKGTSFPRKGSDTVVCFLGGYSKSPFHNHQAVFLSQARGKKLAFLVQPEDWEILKSESSKSCESSKLEECYSLVDPEAPDFDKYPHFSGARVYKAELEVGDILFLPEAWYHYIKGVESPSLSLALFLEKNE